METEPFGETTQHSDCQPNGEKRQKVVQRIIQRSDCIVFPRDVFRGMKLGVAKLFDLTL